MKKEIIDILVAGKINSTIKYKPLFCKNQSYGEEKNFKLISKINIVEGSYCLNPHFGKYYDISIFLKIIIILSFNKIIVIIRK